ncbi:MAG: hypothetical protein RR595_10955 [Lysinibacillus sp.]
MNQFKENLSRELRSISLPEEKQQNIAQKAKKKKKYQARKINWQYRVVLATFAVSLLSLSYLMWQGNDSPKRAQSTASSASASEETSMFSLDWLQNDFVKTIAVILFYVVVRIIAIKILKKKSGLPHCIYCGEEWTYKQAFKLSMSSNQVMACPHCEGKQYRTRKSARQYGMINMIFPCMIFIPMIFDYFVLGLIVHVLGIFYISFSLVPYLVETQEEDPTNKPLW